MLYIYHITVAAWVKELEKARLKPEKPLIRLLH